MKFQPDTSDGVNVITRHEPGRVWVGGTPFGHSLLLPWSGEVLPWGAAAFDALGATHFERLLALAPEVVIFGSGSRLRFPPPVWLRGLIERLPYLQRAGQRTPRGGGRPAGRRRRRVGGSAGHFIIVD